MWLWGLIGLVVGCLVYWVTQKVKELLKKAPDAQPPQVPAPVPTLPAPVPPPEQPPSSVKPPVVVTPPTAQPKTKFNPFYLITKDGIIADGKYAGLWRLKIELVKPEGKSAPLYATSGQPGHQEFHTGPYSIAGSNQPLPQGQWKMGKADWCGGSGDYNTYFNEGLGPVFWALSPQFETGRAEIGVHFDANSSSSPGTAGCVGVCTLQDLKSFVSLTALNPNVDDVFVDWGLGGLTLPSKEATTTPDSKSPHARGAWIWVLDQLRQDWVKALSATGCKRLYLKLVDDSSVPKCWPEINKGLIANIKAAGFEVWGWGYFGNTTNLDSDAASSNVREAMARGLDGFVFDIEAEFEGRHQDYLKALLEKSRPSIPAGKMAFTSFADRADHPDIPWALLDGLCDLHMPQIYFEEWTLKANETVDSVVAECIDSFKELKKPILPIFASEVGARYPASTTDLQRMLDKYPGSSIWRLPQGSEAGHGFELKY